MLGIVLVFAGGFAAYAWVARDMPDLGADPRGRDQTSVIYDRNGEVLAQLFAEQNRTDRPLAEIPANLRNAVIATEDQRYYEHKGVDPISIARAVVVDIVRRSKAQGGSTITQQYIKNAFITDEQTIKRKLTEAVLAYRLEKRFTKDEILELYLNTIYFGHGSYGVESAAQTYFGVSVDELGLAECATLAGVIKSPGRYSPYLEPEAAFNRRNTVLAQMAEQGHITAEEQAAAREAEIEVAGLKPSATVAPYFVEYVKAALAEEIGSETLYRGGVRIETTLDLRMQRAAEAAIAAALPDADDPSAALVAVDPGTGEVLAMVGGRDFTTQQFNVAVQGRRQPGSAFKPFVLAAALEGDTGPEDAFEAGPAKLTLANGQTWSVTGAGGGRTGPMRLREAMEKSVNSVFGALILEVGPGAVVDVCERTGIHEGMLPVPAIALGGTEDGVSPLEMAVAYGTFARNGVRATPYAVSAVLSADGEPLLETTKHTEEVIEPAVAYLVTDVLKGVITRGTGSAANIGRPAAGKTGTTQKYRDAWFVGYTPTMSAAVWVGYPEAQREMNDVHGRRVTGGSFPAEIWAAFMREALSETPSEDFTKPDGVISFSVCSETGQLSTEHCPESRSAIGLSRHRPAECTTHTGPATVTLPDLIGKTKEEAIALLNRLALLFTIVEQEVQGVPAGIVASQNPASGSEVTTSTPITITVSKGTLAAKPPTAQFTFDPRNPAVGQVINFDASGSRAAGRIVKYLWEFGDGLTEEGVTASHYYDELGTYEVVLWVTDDKGQTSSVTHRVDVR